MQHHDNAAIATKRLVQYSRSGDETRASYSILGLTGVQPAYRRFQSKTENPRCLQRGSSPKNSTYMQFYAVLGFQCRDIYCTPSR